MTKPVGPIGPIGENAKISNGDGTLAKTGGNIDKSDPWRGSGDAIGGSSQTTEAGEMKSSRGKLEEKGGKKNFGIENRDLEDDVERKDGKIPSDEEERREGKKKRTAAQIMYPNHGKKDMNG